MIYLAVILFLLAVVFNILWDYSIWQKQLNKPTNTRNHAKGWVLKFVTCIPSAIFFVLISDFKYFWSLLSTALLVSAWFMILFDGGYNLLRGEPFFYRGTEDGADDAKTDNIWQSLPQWLHITVKLLLAFGTLYFYQAGINK